VDPVTLQFICDSTGARPRCAPAKSIQINAVSTDSRSCTAGSLFVAIRGETFDGNAFAADALRAGAGGVLVEPRAAALPAVLECAKGSGRAVLEHPEPESALLQLAKCYRERFQIPVVAVAGAAGKTTTKEITAHLLKSLGPVAASEKSFNNSIGVPHTLFKIDKSTRTAVVEIGTNARGEVAALAAVVSPTLGVITIIAEEHLEGLGDLDGVCAEEGALLDALPADGVAFLNADDVYFPKLMSRARCRVATFGVENAADFAARDLAFHRAGTSFQLNGRPATIPLLGTHNVYNSLAAVAIATTLGVPMEESLRALSELKPPDRRLERKRFGGIEVIDDCYNANPGSVRAAVRALEGLRHGRRRIFVLGKMHELGARSAELHREMGRVVGAARFDLFVTVGAEGGDLARGAVDAGMSPARIVQFPTVADAAEHLPPVARDGDILVVKGSRAEALERVVESLQRAFASRGEEHVS
jgi:UDP-N-acetylmuramoyl-tripeptide--D-alanyl-D-alanine ligase